MGKARNYEIISDRKIVMDTIVNSDTLVELLGVDTGLDTESREQAILWKLVYPHEFIPETTTKTERFINFEIKSNTDLRNKTLKNVTILFFISCHQDVVRIDDDDPYTDLWYDKVVCELEEIFCNYEFNYRKDKSEMGLIGTLDVIDNVPYYPQQKFKGRLLTLKMKDFADGKKNGK